MTEVISNYMGIWCRGYHVRFALLNRSSLAKGLRFKSGFVHFFLNLCVTTLTLSLVVHSKNLFEVYRTPLASECVRSTVTQMTNNIPCDMESYSSIIPLEGHPCAYTREDGQSDDSIKARLACDTFVSRTPLFTQANLKAVAPDLPIRCDTFQGWIYVFTMAITCVR
ncbi:hypothetical protein F5879DRAFT_452728 [Lentinula edodes]|nr:hypothetical protein F5879DRAFT_452728 [Lentinula edodes]